MISISDRLKQEMARRALTIVMGQMQQELEIQRFAEFGRVGASLIHEFGSPVTALMLTLDQMKLAPTKQLMKQAQRDLRRLEKYLIAARNQLLGEGSIKDFSLTVAIHEVVGLLRPKAEAGGIKLLTKTMASIRLYGDRVCFQQALANLINNAIESYDDATDGSKTVHIEVSLNNGVLEISVIDHGKGISPRDITKIFQPFYSTKQVTGRGLGIGLAIVKHHIESGFNGVIKVESNLSHGTKFIIRLPIA